MGHSWDVYAQAPDKDSFIKSTESIGCICCVSSKKITSLDGTIDSFLSCEKNE
jgi:hypothetical protein